MEFIPETIFLIGHGSRDPEGSAEFEEMVRRMAARHAERSVVHGFLEFARPNIPAAVDQAVSRGVRSLLAVPVMLLDAGHAMRDIPGALAAARRRHPDLVIRYGDHLGFHPNMMAGLIKVLRDAGEDPMAERPGRGLLLVGRGSSDPVANSNFYKFSRLVWERTRFETVENAFIGITRPTLREGLERCRQIGLSHVVVAPYFLFTGALYKKIAAITKDFFEQYPGQSWSLTRYFGLESLVLDAVADRIADGLAGRHRAYRDEWMRNPEGIRYARHGHDHHHQAGHDHDHHPHHDHDHNHPRIESGQHREQPAAADGKTGGA
ncbi:MAG: sirohydrochlorin chelatase [Thermaerobacter sp.]|nr:sirohydrochlorin chelatase [Thermaerobacter sp.]